MRQHLNLREDRNSKTACLGFDIFQEEESLLNVESTHYTLKERIPKIFDKVQRLQQFVLFFEVSVSLKT